MVQDSPSRKLDQYIVRFPDGMRDRLKAAAEENGRSMNAEIVKRLQDTLDFEDFKARWDEIPTVGPGTTALDEIREEIKKLRAQLIEVRIMPDGDTEYTIRRDKKQIKRD